MKKRNILLSVAFMAVAAVALVMSVNTSTEAQASNNQMAYQVHQADFDGKCGEGKCGTTDTKAKGAKATKTDEKSKCGDGKATVGTKDTKATKGSTDTKSKCGDGKSTTETKDTKATKSTKEKCGSGKCGDGK